MVRLSISLLFIVIVFSGCNKPGVWTKHGIEKKLRKVFPDATTILILDSAKIRRSSPDSLDSIPLPAYKALISEKGYPGYSFVFYFYNTKDADSALKEILKTVVKNDLYAVFGAKKPGYVFCVPKFDMIDLKMIVYGVSLRLEDDYDLADRESTIIDVFDLPPQKSELKKDQ